jgi:hypothetical protein
MAWELRAGRRYYYRAEKVNGRVVKTYVGPGLAGELAEETDRIVRRERETLGLREHERIDRLEQVDALARDLARSATALFRGAMLAAGLRRHRKGEWRKPIGSSSNASAPT